MGKVTSKSPASPKGPRTIATRSNEYGQQRQLAKAGMVGSLGALFITGFMRFKGARIMHPYIGWALLGFSIWHHLVSKPPSK